MSAAQRLAAGIAAQQPIPSRLIKAKVLVVTLPTLTLNIRGATVPGVSKLASYTSPAVGDIVAVQAYGATYLVLGEIG